MRREPIVRSAVLVVLTWTVLFGLFNRKTVWHLLEAQWGNMLWTGLLILISAVVGLIFALWLSSETHEARINALVPQIARGIKATIGPVPLHKKPEPFWGNQFNAKDPVASVRAVFAAIRADAGLLPPELRYGQDNPNGIDLDGIEQAVLGLPAPYIAVFDAVLRILMHHRALLTTYEQEGHGRHNGQGGRTLLQHSLLVCQWTLKLSEDWVFDGMHTTNKDGTPGEIAYPPRGRAQKGYRKDPLVPLIGLAHDIGKIQCYQWRKGEAEPYTLLPNHDTVGARMLAVVPQIWDLPQTDTGGSDAVALMTIIAFYHHPSEQPMDGAGMNGGAVSSGKNRIILDLGGVQIRSDRQVALTELLIAADKKAGSIEHQSVVQALSLLPAGAVDQEAGAPTRAAAPQAVALDVAIWESIETVLLEPGRINAKQMRGMVSSMSVGTRHVIPAWGGPVLVLKEDDFVKAVISRTEMPKEKRDFYVEEIENPSQRGNAVNQATLLVLRTLHAHGMLMTPPGQPPHTPETSLWKVAYYEPKNAFADGANGTQMLGKIVAKPMFSWGSAIVCAPAQALPSVAAGDPFHLMPVCTGNRLGNQGNTTKKQGARGRPRKSVLDDDLDAVNAQGESGGSTAESTWSKESAPSGSYAMTFVSLLENGLRQKVLTAHSDKEGRIVMDALFEEIVGLLGVRTNMGEISSSLLGTGDNRVSLEETLDQSGRSDYLVLLDAAWFHQVMNASAPKESEDGDPDSDAPEIPMQAQEPQDEDGDTFADPHDVDLVQEEFDPVGLDAMDDEAGPPEDDGPPEAPEIPEEAGEVTDEAPAPATEDQSTSVAAQPPAAQVIESSAGAAATQPGEDGYVVFQRTLADYLRKAGPEALAKKKDKSTGEVIDYAVKGPVEELFQKCNTEEALVEFPDEGAGAEMGVITASNGMRILRISPSWLERRDLLG